jgi:ribonuclease P/MRP protein subunit RPP40
MGNTNWVEVLSGVQQGIRLGPILFLVFINDLDDVVRMIIALKKFADDT